MNTAFPRYAALALVAALSGCVTSVEKEVDIHPSVQGDKEYAQTLKKSTGQYQVISNFENRYELFATVLTQEFRNALATRYETLYNEKQPLLEEASDKLAFFVSVYTANKEVRDIRDADLWNVQLESDGHIQKPVAIKYVSKKERWQPFFDYISPWSREYLVLFEIPAAGMPSDEFVRSAKTKLIFTNADGKVTIHW